MSQVVVSPEGFDDLIICYITYLLVKKVETGNILFDKIIQKMNSLGMKSNFLLAYMNMEDVNNRIKFNQIKRGLLGEVSGRTAINITNDVKEI
jgi:hypothetical protein